MQSQPEDHSITLPLVSKEEENICLPLVINVVSKYWGEEIQLEEAMAVARKYPGMKGSIMMEGIELAEKHGFTTYIYRGSIKDLQKADRPRDSSNNYPSWNSRNSATCHHNIWL